VSRWPVWPPAACNLTDDLKARVLSTFLTLMNLRENLDRASMRTPAGRSGIFR